MGMVDVKTHQALVTRSAQTMKCIPVSCHLLFEPSCPPAEAGQGKNLAYLASSRLAFSATQHESKSVYIATRMSTKAKRNINSYCISMYQLSMSELNSSVEEDPLREGTSHCWTISARYISLIASSR